MMKIQTTNIHLVPSTDQYSEKLWMLVQTLNNPVLSTALSSSFALPMEQLSFSSSIVVFNKTNMVVMFQLVNPKMKKLTRKQFSQILKFLVSDTFYEVLTDQVLYMFNEMWNQQILTSKVTLRSQVFLAYGVFCLELCYIV